MTKIKHVQVMSLAKLMTVINAVFGFLMGCVVTLSALMGVDMTQGQMPANTMVQKFAVVYFPVLYAVGGFVGGVLTAVIFNTAVKWIGPLELDIEVDR